MPLSGENIRVRSAVTSDAQALTRLVFRAKAFWGYPKEWMEEWRKELSVTSDYVAQHRVVLAEAEQRLVAFYGLEFRTDVAHLEHLWVEPAYIGSGLGRKLLALACEDARNNGYKVIELVADPNAEGFYLRQGAIRIGEIRGNVLGKPRVLPKMQLVLSGANNVLQATCEDARA
jgi:N-acetylglutamate synthase-like GNAT family acetyltransferase